MITPPLCAVVKTVVTLSQGPGRHYMALLIHTVTNPLLSRRGTNTFSSETDSVLHERLLKCPSLHLPHCVTLKTIHCIPSHTCKAFHVDTIILW